MRYQAFKEGDRVRLVHNAGALHLPVGSEGVVVSAPDPYVPRIKFDNGVEQLWGTKYLEKIVTDDKGNTLTVGDRVKVLYVNRDRGAEVWMDVGVVCGFGRTRVSVKFPSRERPQSVGSECLRKIPSA